MSENASSAENQQGSCLMFNKVDPSETTRRAPISRKAIRAYFLGALHDGTFNKNKRHRISQKGTEWLILLKKLLNDLGYNAWMYKEGKERDVYVLETLADFLDFHFDPLQFSSRIEKICYIRGFFDAEGGIPRNANDRFYIQLMQSDIDKIEKLKYMLTELGIETGVIHNPSKKRDPNHWRIFVRANSYTKFISVIGSWHPRKVRTLRERVKI